MATLKEHQATMVDLLANGSGIPASASRLAHAMHDVLEAMMNQAHEESMQQSKDFIRKFLNDRAEARRMTVECGDATPPERPFLKRQDATTPGLNDKALSKREKALKTDSPAKWPTPAEQRVKELENTIKQLKAQRAKDRAELERLRIYAEHDATPEQAGCRKPDTQAGCRKPDTQVCEHLWNKTDLYNVFECLRCGVQEIKK